MAFFNAFSLLFSVHRKHPQAASDRRATPAKILLTTATSLNMSSVGPGAGQCGQGLAPVPVENTKNKLVIRRIYEKNYNYLINLSGNYKDYTLSWNHKELW